MIINGIKIEYVPNYAMDCEYIVCRECYGVHYFYGAYNDKQRAEYAAMEVGGYCMYNRQ